MVLYIKFLLRSLNCDRGSIAVIIALAFIPILIGTGAALDFGRAYLVKARLSYALDTAGLAIGASNPSANLQQILNNFFKANYSATEVGVATTPNFEIKDGIITLAVKARLETTFLNFFGKKFIDITVNSEVTRNTKGLEVVLVLDNTGSMGARGKMDALKAASNTLINDLFRDETTSASIKMGLVPFVTTVNIGKNNNTFVTGSEDNEYPTGLSWKGCVEARQIPHEISDTYNTGGQDGISRNWNPYYWEAETESVLNGRFSGFCTNSWRSITPPAPVFYNNRQRGTGRSDNLFRRSGSFIGLDENPPVTQGPNKACPDPVTPLTNQKSELTRAINKMQPWEGNGTMANLGAVWGWRLLSPTPPFQEGSAYDNEKINKAIVIMTDGQNLISPLSQSASGVRNGGGPLSEAALCSIVSSGKYTSHYTGYGYISEGKLGTTNLSNAGLMLNNRLTQVCDNIKQKGIVIFTVVFQLNNPQLQTLFQNCATTPGNFFNSPDNEKLASAFRAIGAELNSLRVSR